MSKDETAGRHLTLSEQGILHRALRDSLRILSPKLSTTTRAKETQMPKNQTAGEMVRQLQIPEWSFGTWSDSSWDRYKSGILARHRGGATLEVEVPFEATTEQVCRALRRLADMMEKQNA